MNAGPSCSPETPAVPRATSAVSCSSLTCSTSTRWTWAWTASRRRTGPPLTSRSAPGVGVYGVVWLSLDERLSVVDVSTTYVKICTRGCGCGEWGPIGLFGCHWLNSCQWLMGLPLTSRSAPGVGVYGVVWLSLVEWLSVVEGSTTYVKIYTGGRGLWGCLRVTG